MQSGLEISFYRDILILNPEYFQRFSNQKLMICSYSGTGASANLESLAVFMPVLPVQRGKALLNNRFPETTACTEFRMHCGSW